MKRRILSGLFLVLIFTLGNSTFSAPSDPFQQRTSTSSDPFQDVEEEKEIQPIDASPIIDHRTSHLALDLDKSIFDEPSPDQQKKGGRDGEKNNPPIPIDDHLHWLALGGILLFSIALKKGWFR